MEKAEKQTKKLKFFKPGLDTIKMQVPREEAWASSGGSLFL